MHTAYYRLGDGIYAERFGLGFEHLAPGQRYIHRPGMTFSQQDNVEEALDSVNSAMVHYDEHYAAQTEWRRPLMVSTLTLQRLIGMTAKTFGRRRRIASMSSIALTRPVFGGDTLYAETEVLAAEPVDAESGRASLLTRGFNQRGEQVAELRYVVELWRSTTGPDRVPDARPATEERFLSHVQRDDGAWVEQTGLFFEDLRRGETIIHAPRKTLLAEEATLHALRSMEWQPQSHDYAFAHAIGLPAPVVPQTWGVAVAVALSTRTFGRVSVNLGWTDVEFGVDLMPGDTLEARSTVEGARPSGSRPDRGVVTVLTEARNQRGEMVNRFRRALMVYRRAAAVYSQAGY
ncbi:MaoC/PaaZ C-terminal domain-containing protein [uncultured Pigmentiphaga sp.]|uniref:MaoC/PaaZ C-terminal domain-containing protein n=2 Tax=Pigmentiphaga TaxID=152267 RepID=UPI00261B8E35|nr:MaoC/PaaZ C-terminal domain-containing protein [uncultured Pigmentiphaga sp.]